MVSALLAALGTVFVAELGDKSQLMTLTLAARYRAGPVLAGITIAAAVLAGLSVAGGALLGAFLPRRTVELAAGAAFLAFALWVVLDTDGEDEAELDIERGGRSRVLAVAGAFALAELGDKTMLATAALAASRSPLGVWIGATLGMVAANLLAVVVGGQLADRLPERVLRYGAGALFAAFGVLLLLGIL